MLKALREQVYEANISLVQKGLVVETFGNVSGADRAEGVVVIKPSGVAYSQLRPADLVVTDLAGRRVEGILSPSSDLPTHLALYEAFPHISGVAHTHSRHATAWAQARQEIPCFGTTHADYFHGAIPVTADMAPEEILTSYEWNTGLSIRRRFADIDPGAMRAVLVAGHAPFTWGKDAAQAAHLAFMLEELAQLAFMTIAIKPAATEISDSLRDKHFLRKHGPAAYYGQR